MATSLAPGKLRVRMYRVGFGDCFLVSLPVADQHRHLLIDCGVHFRGDIKTMPRIVENLRAETLDHLDLVVVSHAHQDHISGFGTQAQQFSQVSVREVWMPWTENPADAQAVALRNKQLSTVIRIREHLQAAGRLKRATEAILENFAGFNLTSNANCLRVVRTGFKRLKRVRYLAAGKQLRRAAGIPGLQVEVLGPSRDESVLAQMDPPSGQRWLRTGRTTARSPDHIQPFVSQRRGRGEMRKIAPGCLLTPRLEKQLHNATLADDALALTLDNILNNTSLVLLLRFRGAALLFPGDAQWGNWSTWLNTSAADSLLDEITFFKVGHHGSHNATPSSVVPKLRHQDLAAMVSTQNAPFASIPRGNLVDALTKQSRRRIGRSDWIAVRGARNERTPSRWPSGFQPGEFWLDYTRDMSGLAHE